MRVLHVQQSRPEWYDRSPAVKKGSYQADGVAPHANTTRFSYTVPAGKKFALQAGSAAHVRATAAGALGAVTAALTFTPSGGTGMYLCWARSESIVADTNRAQTISGTVVAAAGDAFFGETTDLSTGGTVDYMVSLQGIEFDA